RQRSRNGFLIRFSAPKMTAPAWGWQSPRVLLTNTAATLNLKPNPAKARPFGSYCPPPNRKIIMSKVLLIEDEKALAAALQRVLEMEGHEVVAATDSNLGLSAARDGDFQVVVTDLKMPGVTGMEVLKTLHDPKPQLP